jgi:hypothetical protein
MAVAVAVAGVSVVGANVSVGTAVAGAAIVGVSVARGGASVGVLVGELLLQAARASRVPTKRTERPSPNPHHLDLTMALI